MEKKILKVEYASAYSASVYVLTAIVSLVFLPFIGLDISLKNWILIYIVSIMTTVSYVLTARIFRHGTLSATSPLNNTLPTLFIVLFASFFLNEILTATQYIGVGITILACYMLLSERGSKKDFDNKKYKYVILINAIIAGISALIFKYVLFSTDPIAYVVISQIFSAFNMIIYMNFKYGGIKEILTNTKVYRLELAAIVLLTVAYKIFYYSSVKLAPVGLAYALQSTLVIIMTVFSGSLIFKEGNMRNKIMLSVMILIGAALMIL